jgi:hypothetical protein
MQSSRDRAALTGLGQAVSQVDIGFVKENSAFRRHRCQATPEQRTVQNRAFYEHFQPLLAATAADGARHRKS